MKVAIQLWTWTKYAKEQQKPFNLKQALQEARKAGYEAVEAGGGEELLGSPNSLRQAARAAGLDISAYGTHVFYNPYPANVKDYQADMRYAAKLGVKTMMVCGGFNHYERRNQYPADYDMFGKSLGAALKFAHRLGLEIAYHPHKGCIVETAAETALLLKRLPDLKLCVDIAHLEASGDDAVKFINRFGKRIIYTHIKDYDVKKNAFTELGRGNSNLVVSRCVKALEKVGYDGWLTVEQDKLFRPPLETAQISRRYLKKHGY